MDLDLDPNQQGRLRQIYHLFDCAEGDPDINRIQRPGKGGSTNSRRKRERQPRQAAVDPRSSPQQRHQWRPIMKMASTAMPPEIEILCRNPETSVDLFLSDENLLRYQPTPPGTDPTTSAADLGDFFIHTFEYAIRIQDRGIKDRCRSNFLDLFWFDFVKFIRPQATGRRVGKLMLEEARELLADFTNMRQGMSVEQIYEHLDKWSRCGAKIDALCGQFGEGCIFYLQDVLSRDL